MIIAVVPVGFRRRKDREAPGAKLEFRAHRRMLHRQTLLFDRIYKRLIGLTVMHIITADDIFHFESVQTADQAVYMIGIVMAADQVVERRHSMLFQVSDDEA